MKDYMANHEEYTSSLIHGLMPSEEFCLFIFLNRFFRNIGKIKPLRYIFLMIAKFKLKEGA